MKELQRAAFDSIYNSPANFSIKGLVDLSLLSTKCVALAISKNQYIELLGSFGFFLNNKNALLIGDSGAAELAPKGFSSVFDRLMEKVSLEVYNNFQNTSLLIYIKNTKSFMCNKTEQSVIIGPSVSFEELCLFLKQTEYERVSKVTDVKQFCIKGGIVDFYSPTQQAPIRAYFYDDSPRFVYYNLLTGFPENNPIKQVSLNKKGKKTFETKISSIVQKKGFVVIDANKKTNKTIKVVELKDEVFQKIKKETHYLTKIQYSAYQFNNHIYAPSVYKNIKEQKSKNISFVPGFERGDLVCHEDFGVGQFVGLVKDSSSEEVVIKIKYLDGTINLSVKKMFKVSFVSRETEKGSLIGSLNKKGAWNRKKLLIKKNIDIYVDNLVSMYTKNKSVVRPAYLPGGELEESFIDSFKFVDTKDQGVVWGEIKKDLEGSYPMSRLLCGDVGFGKTEIAVRAAFRVVVNGGRVVVLCPTSVLVGQHFGVFLDRLSNFGVVVSSLVGGARASTKTALINDWVDKKIDVLIATSAALYDDVFIKFASLFIIDEEHRFGVKQKEVLVNKFVNKDVLFMSATPIPRTLHLGLSGVHNISTLSTPPVSRKPINTVVSYFSEELIKQGVYFELSRGGQVFYLHNRIDSILSVRSFLSRLCPAAKIAVIHSRLGIKKINSTIQDFVNKKYNLLLCSSVIGAGIDIPNANTIFIDNAHLFGLSQLHQIRGRVGRGVYQGFAYLLVPKEGRLTPSGIKRLKTIEQNSSLGAGYNLSKVDLEIRGGGTMFGYKQSGSNHDVGYEYYSKVVSKSFEEKTKNSLISCVDAFSYQVSFVCALREKYISLDYERLQCYRELSSLYSVGSVGVFKVSLIEIYGPLLPDGENLLNMRVVSILCGSLNINSLVYNNEGLTLFFNNNFIGVDFLVKFLELYKTKYSVLSFAFNVVNDSTSLVVSFSKGCIVDGLFLKRFIGGFNVFYKK